jgi:hypothetical protein
VLIIPSLGVPNWSVIYINTAPQSGPPLDEGFYVGVALAKGGECRQSHNSICRQMMGLELVVIQEVLEKITNRESESLLKVCYEDHPLSWFRCRHSFASGQPT